MTIVKKWRLMMSSFADIKAAIIEMGGTLLGAGYACYANGVRSIYSDSGNDAEYTYPVRAAETSAAQHMLTVLELCKSVKEQIRQAIIDGGVECDTSVPLSDYGDKIRQIVIADAPTKITLPTATAGQPYSYRIDFPGAQGYTFKKPVYQKDGYDPGIWPQGLSISSDGVFSGNLTANGTFMIMYIIATSKRDGSVTLIRCSITVIKQ